MSLFLKSVQKRRRGECSKFELGSLPSIDRDRRSRGAEFKTWLKKPPGGPALIKISNAKKSNFRHYSFAA